MTARPILSFASLVVLAGGIVMQLLVILSGGVNGDPVNRVFFLEADTSGINPGTRNPSRWTFFAICGASGGKNADCGAIVPALPFDPPRNFGTEDGVPQQFIGTRHYYLISRFMFAFYLIALFFASISLMTGLLALCSRLGGYLSGLNTMIALGAQAIAASLMTVWVVQGRNAFRSNDQSANIGRYGVGFTWGAMAAFMVATVLFCVSGGVSKDRSYSSKNKRRSLDAESQRGRFK